MVKTFFEQLPSRYQTMDFGSLPAALGVQLYFDENKRSFTDEPKFGPEILVENTTDYQNERRRRFPTRYFYCHSEILKNGATSLGVTPTNDLMEFLYSLNADDVGNRYTVTYNIFLESMRQQICQGVGLRCPFWNGECCRSDIRELLKILYWRTEPWKWHEHWQKPPCLD
jgi:hypothetical protein